MAEQEREHLDKFNELIGARRVRPTALMPVWHAAGFALGAATALMGERAAMACTAAVEEVIDEHYAKQAAALGDDEAELRETIEKFREDELEHRDTAIAHEAEETPGYEALAAVIKKGSKLAIWLSERVWRTGFARADCFVPLPNEVEGEISLSSPLRDPPHAGRGLETVPGFPRR